MSRSAFLFPGQGSQSLGMLADLAAGFAVVGATFEEASQVLGYDLWAVSQHGPEERLNRTEVTQPAMLTADVATWRAWRETGGFRPGWVAGHSLGEYAALVAADSIEFADAVALVAERGRLMQAATPEGVGAMAAIIGLEDDQVEAACVEAAEGQVVGCANFNAPGQVVIAGHREAVERACAAARAAGARRALPLPVSVPSHCPLMREAATGLERALQGLELRPPAIPVLHNVDAGPRHDPAEIRAALARQLWQPVQWTGTVRRLAEAGAKAFYECGPGRVLAGLNRRIARDLPVTALVDGASLRAAIEGEQP